MRLLMLKTEAGSVIPAALDENDVARDLSGLFKEAQGKGLLRSDLRPNLDSVLESPDPKAVTGFLSESLHRAPAVELKDYRIDVPLRSGDIICVGRNYTAHAKEMRNPVPAQPILFMKPRSTLVATSEDIVLQKEAVRVELEGEIALVIGNDLFGDVKPEIAVKAIFGVTLLNDVTDRGEQKLLKESGLPWLRAKGRPTFAPCGPIISVIEDCEVVDNLRFSTRINGAVCQEGNTSEWIWSAGELLSSIASSIGLSSGTIVATGTPAGVREIKSGDHIEITCGFIGKLENYVTEQFHENAVES